RHRVELLGAVEHEGADPVLDLDPQLLKGHGHGNRSGLDGPLRVLPCDRGQGLPLSASPARSLRNTVGGSMPSMRAVSALFPLVIRRVSSRSRCSTSASGVPTLILKNPSPGTRPSGPALSSSRTLMTDRSTTASGSSAVSTRDPRARTTAR